MATGVIDSIGAVRHAQSVMRLAPETLQWMSRGARPLTQAGVNLGALEMNGKIVAQVKWLQGAGATATAVSVAANLGTAVALAAIQMQLARMQKQLDEIGRTTREIKGDMFAQTRVSVSSHEHNIRRLTQRHIDVGHLDAVELTSLDASRQALHEAAGNLRKRIDKETAKLSDAKTVSERLAFMKLEANDLIENVEALMIAEQLEYYSTALLDLHRAESPDQLQRMLDSAQTHWQRGNEATRSLVTRAHRTVYRISVDAGKRGPLQRLTTPGEARSLRNRSVPIAAYLKEASGDEVPDVHNAAARFLVLDAAKDDGRGISWDTIAYSLEPGEALELAALGEQDALVLTDRRLLCIDGAHPSILRWKLDRLEIQGVELVHHDSWTAKVTDNGRSIHLRARTSSAPGKSHRFDIGDGPEALAFAHRVHNHLADALSRFPRELTEQPAGEADLRVDVV